MRNHYIIRFEVAPAVGSHTLSVTMPVDSNTTADEVLEFLLQFVAKRCARDINMPQPFKRESVRFQLIALVHQST